MLELILSAPRQVVVQRMTGEGPVRKCDEVTVQVSRISLCGSDFHLYQGSYKGPHQYPLRFGHEWAGVVVDARKGGRIPVGAQVTGDCSMWCGKCARCATDRNLCRHIQKFGITQDGFSVGLRAVSERYLYVAPPGLDASCVALTELFAVALRGVQLVAAARRRPILIIGAGPLGIATALVARWSGFAKVVLLENNPVRQRLVTQLFPELQLWQPKRVELPETPSYALIEEEGLFPAVLDCAGGAAALNCALWYSAIGGTIVSFGIGQPGVVRSELLVAKALRLLGSIGGTGAFPQALDLLSGHAAEARRMVTHCFAASDATEALAQGSADCEHIKVQISF